MAPLAPPSAVVSAELPRDGGAPFLCYVDEFGRDVVEIPDAAIKSLHSYNPYRAKMFIPCTHGRCPGRMQLRIVDDRKNPLSRAYYLCDQDGKTDRTWRCPNSQERVYPEDLPRSNHIGTALKPKPKYKSNESLSREEMETMI